MSGPTAAPGSLLARSRPAWLRWRAWGMLRGIGLVLLVNLFFVLAGWQHLGEARRLAFVTAGAKADRLSLALSRVCTAYLQRADLVLESMGQAYRHARTTGGGESVAIAASLNGLAGQASGASAIGILNERGKRVFAWRAEAGGLSLAPNLPPAMLNGELPLHVSPLQRDGRVVGLLLARRLLQLSGEFVGVAYAYLDLGHFREALPGNELGAAGGAYLLDVEDRSLVAGFGGDGETKVLGELLAASDFLAARSAGQGSASLRLGPLSDGTERILSWHGVGGYPLVAAVALADVDFLAAWHERWVLVVVYSLMLALVSLLGFVGWFQRRYAVGSHQAVPDSGAEARPGALPPADALTGLPEIGSLRGLLRERIEQARLERRSLAVCHLNIDDFGSVNACYGREVGDSLLIQVAQCLQAGMRHHDIVARLGGDEFVLILAPLDGASECELALKRLLAAFATPRNINGISIKIFPSIGATIYPVDDSDADTLLRHADHAMYLAKQGGGNRIAFFDPVADEGEKTRRQSLERIKLGLARREFKLHYQPKVDLRSGKAVGFEALIRWQHPDDGLLSPANFLPLVEDNELIVDLGYWTLRAALDDLVVWHRSGYALTVSVNLAARHLQSVDFFERLQQLLAGYPELPAGALELEVLETTAVGDVDHVVNIMLQCRKLGVTFALDDFGTGYSSLTYFRKLPAQSIKIDQSFVREMLFDPDDYAIVEGIVDLTRAFDRQPIAEGVEDVPTAMLLLALGCTIVQGYAIARPMPVAYVLPWLREWPDECWRRVREQPIPRERIPLVTAEGNHLAWSRRVVDYVEGRSDEYPLSDPRESHIGRWCCADVDALQPRIDALRRQSAAVAERMLMLADAGQVAAARQMLPEFRGVSAALGESLGRLRATILALDGAA